MSDGKVYVILSFAIVDPALDYYVDAKLLPNGSLIGVATAELERFRLTTTKATSTPVLNKQQQRELVLKSWLEEKGLLGKEVEQTRMTVWNELNKIDPTLFPPQENPNSSVKELFKKQQLCTIKPGRPKGGLKNRG